MLWIALLGFVLTAGGGVLMARQRFRGGGNPSKPLVAIHGMAATFGLVSLIVLLPGEPHPVVVACLAAFAVTAAGGLTLLTFHARGKLLPGAVVLGHGLLALAAISLLLVSALQVPDPTGPDLEETAHGEQGTLR